MNRRRRNDATIALNIPNVRSKALRNQYSINVHANNRIALMRK